MEFLKTISLFAGAFLLSFLLVPPVKRLAFKIGAIDIPKDDRRVHTKPIPRLGGLAIVSSFLLVALLFVPLTFEMRTMLGASLLIVCMGIIDDTKALGAKPKLLIQVAAALIAVAGGVRIEYFRLPFLPPGQLTALGFLSIPISVFWIVGITNTINFIDGLDGLSAGVSAISALTLGIIALTNNSPAAGILLLVLAGSTLGFLPWNFNPAQIFMGDTGALFIGFILGCITIEGTVKTAAAVAVLVPLLCLAIPIFDTTFAILRRLRAGRSIMSADKGHLHHRLLQNGLSQRQAVLRLYLFSGIFGLSALVMTKLAPLQAALVLAADFVLLVVGLSRLGILARVRKEFFS